LIRLRLHKHDQSSIDAGLSGDVVAPANLVRMTWNASKRAAQESLDRAVGRSCTHDEIVDDVNEV